MPSDNRLQARIIGDVFKDLVAQNQLNDSQILLLYLQAKEEYRNERGIPIRHEYQHPDEACIATDEQLYIARRMVEQYQALLTPRNP